MRCRVCSSSTQIVHSFIHTILTPTSAGPIRYHGHISSTLSLATVASTMDISDVTASLNEPEGVLPASLLRLPAELRNHIYEEVLRKDNAIDVSTLETMPRPSLLRACKQIRAEANLIYFACNDFLLCVSDSTPRAIPGAMAELFEEECEAIHRFIVEYEYAPRSAVMAVYNDEALSLDHYARVEVSKFVRAFQMPDGAPEKIAAFMCLEKLFTEYVSHA